MVHGDLKGVCVHALATAHLLLTFRIKANILIDRNNRARLADFGFLTIVLDPTNSTTSGSFVVGGTTRWMSPELLDQDLTGPEGTRMTKRSDCYALGMVIYEVLSGQAPFMPSHSGMVILKVVRGERPGRPNGPGGTRFTDDLWWTLNLCWEAQPQSRPSVGAVLECLELVSEARGARSQIDESLGAGDDGGLAGNPPRMLPWFNPRHFFTFICSTLCLSQLEDPSQ